MSAAEWLFTDEFDLARRKKYQPAPELALAAAVLGEARIDLLRGPGHLPQTKALYDATRAWIESDRTDWPYAFVPLCEVLGLEVELTREKLLSLKPDPSIVRLELIRMKPKTMPTIATIKAPHVKGVGWRRKWPKEVRA